MITTETCSYCKGSGQAERLEEKRESGWHSNTMLSHDVAEAWIASDRDAPLRYVTCDCPKCDGFGHYAVEYVRCKIF